jgi:hypothetical protein
MHINRAGLRVARIALAVVVAVSMMAFAAGPGASRAEAASQTTLNQYWAWMVQAKAEYPYPQTLDKMWRVMMCESSGQVYASGGGGRWLGLFQYAPTTWRGKWNPYRYSSIWNAKAQIFATARAWNLGMQSAWSCYYITKGR